MSTATNLEAPAELLNVYKKVWELQNQSARYLHGHFGNHCTEQLFPAESESGIPLVKRVKLQVNQQYFCLLFSQIVEVATQCLDNAGSSYLNFQNEIFTPEDIENILRGDYQRKGLKSLNADQRTVLYFLIELSVRPILRALAEMAKNLNHRDWDSNICPVCGRKPGFAMKTGEYYELVCISCYSQWKYSYLKCCHCGMTDQNSLIELIPEGIYGHKVMACNQCKGYIKIFDENVDKGIDKQYLEISTIYLDLLALAHGYKKDRTEN